ncbi:MAG: dihydrodipicolinate synthase family protein [Acidobacteria bacterium]|nr:dihydrodipicolinate synthase family protein [Acidobacteriota bacterium]
MRDRGLLEPVLTLALAEARPRGSPNGPPQAAQNDESRLLLPNPNHPIYSDNPTEPRPQGSGPSPTPNADFQRSAPSPTGTSGEPVIAIAGVCGPTEQAIREATLAKDLGYDAALLSMAAITANEIEHVRAIAEIIPVVGFYLQPAVGGRVLPYDFWRKFAEIDNVIGIKMAPFNRYQTIDVVRAIAESGRDDITLYTGNDENIVLDLLTPHRFAGKTVRIKGGLLGHWAVWTRRAVELHKQLQTAEPTKDLLQLAIEVTDSNAAFFDAANQFHGCIPGIHEVLRRQGLLTNLRTLDPAESLGLGQLDEIDRVYRAYPHLNDDAFVAENLDRWLQ